MSNREQFHLRHRTHILIYLLISLIGICVLGILYGSTDISLHDVYKSLFRYDSNDISHILIRNVRLPRVLAGAFAGIGLSLSGVILQTVMNNSMVSPNLIGVNTGAGLAILVVMIFVPSMYYLIPVAAFFGAFMASLLIFLVAYKAGLSRIAIVLAGIALSSILNAGINAVTLLYPELAINSSAFMNGGLSGILMEKILLPAAIILIVFLISILLSNHLNILNLGDAMAASIGLNVNVVRFIFIALSSVLAGSVISYAGLLSFVGLIVPHICRKLVGSDARYLVPSSALFGGGFVVLCDLIGRIVFAPYELPVGILMSFIGGPFFIYLLLSKKGKRLNA